MKKIILTSAVTFLLGINVTSYAQKPFSLGLKAKATLSNVKLTDKDDNKDKFNPGVALGGFINYEFNNYFALQADLMANYTETKVKFGGEKNRYKYMSAELPVYAKGQLPIGSGKLFLGVGPHIGYGFSIDSKNEHRSDDHLQNNNKIELNHWYAGGGAIFGYEFKNGISIHSGYQLSYDLKSGENRHQIKSQNVSLGLGLRF